MIVDEDHYVPAFSTGLARTRLQGKASAHATSRQWCARWSIQLTRKTSKQVHALQDGFKASQKDVGKFEVPNWDQASQKKVRDALLVLNTTITDFKNGFGAKGEVDPIMHLIGTASGWGGNPDKDATYAKVTPAKNDGTTVYKLSVKDVPVDGFWSVSVYNEEGYFEKNPRTPIRSTTSRPRKKLMAQSSFSLAAAMAKFQLHPHHEGLERCHTDV